MTVAPSRSRARALMAFEHAIATCLDAGQRVPCLGDDRSFWTSDDPYEIDVAVLACRSCPVLSACGTYVVQWPEGPGVWAGAYRAAPSSWSSPRLVEWILTNRDLYAVRVLTLAPWAWLAHSATLISIGQGRISLASASTGRFS